MQKRMSMLIGLVTALSATSSVVWAQDAGESVALEEIVITAERREVDLQKAALAVTAISGEDLQQHGDATMAGVLQNVPSVVIQSAENFGTSGGPPNISIRGLGTDGPNKSPSTAVYEDGVLVVGAGSFFHDLNRVEVLRGPQGTLYGRGATAGAMNIISNDPTQQEQGSAQAEFGSYGTTNLAAMINLPLGSDLAARLSVDHQQHDGYFNNGQSDQNETNARLKVLYKPSDDLSLLLGGTYWKSDAAGPGQIALSANGVAQDWTTDVPSGSMNHITYKKTYATLNWNVGIGRLTYIPAYQSIEAAGSSYGGPGNQITAAPKNTTWTHELRLASLQDSFLTWVAGAYYFDHDLYSTYVAQTPNSSGVYTNAFEIDQTLKQTSKAVFGELTYPVSSSLRLTGGVRKTWDHVDNLEVDNFGTPTPIPFTHSYNHFDWKARVETDVSDSSLLYGSVSTGYRPGGVAVDGASYDQEVLKAYEVGSKNRIGSRLTVNAAVFYYDYSGFQTPQSVVDPANPNIIIGQIIAVIPAKFLGVELETVALLTPNDKLTFSPTYLKAHFTGNVDLGYTVPTDGGETPHSPKWSMSGSYAHTFDLGDVGSIVAEADAHYQSKQYASFDVSNYPSANPAFLQDGYTVADASLSYATADGKYRVSAYGKNLTNKIYKLLTNPGPGGYSSVVNDPRTYGLIISANF